MNAVRLDHEMVTSPSQRLQSIALDLRHSTTVRIFNGHYIVYMDSRMLVVGEVGGHTSTGSAQSMRPQLRTIEGIGLPGLSQHGWKLQAISALLTAELEAGGVCA